MAMQRLTTLCLAATLAAPALAQDTSFQQCLDGLRPTARANGVNETTLRAHTDSRTFCCGIGELNRL